MQILETESNAVTLTEVLKTLSQFVIKSDVAPHEIDIFDKRGSRDAGKPLIQFGIYELKNGSLKIELAKRGQSRPKEFSTDKDKLPEGHVVLKLEREQLAASKAESNR